MFGSKPKIITDEKMIDEVLTRGVEEVINKEELRKKLKSGQQLRIKLGIDPTSPNIHLGRTIPLLKLKDFQDLGHKIILIIGDFTGLIGDTSDKDSERPMLTEDVVKKNLESYIEQAGKIIDIKKCEVRYNSEWLGKLDYYKIGKQADVFSLSDFISRDNIKKRLDIGKRISLRELLYPLMQGYDSVAIKADVEIGGTDQKFNLLAGRDLQRLYDQKPQDIMTLTLIPGLDKRKMSSSWGNTINLLDSPGEIFGKVMSLPDDLIETYNVSATRAPMWNSSNMKENKISLAKEIVGQSYDEKAAEKAAKVFESTFSKREFPDDAKVLDVSKTDKLIDVLVESGVVESKSEFRRLVEAGAVSDFPDKKIIDPNEEVGEGKRKIKVGKRVFVVLKS